MRVRRYKFNRKMFITIVDDFDCPVDPYVSNYINAELSMKSINTTKRYVDELLFVLRFFQSESIDLVERVSSGSFLKAHEYQKFYESSFSQQKLNTKPLKKVDLVSTNNKDFRNIISASIHKKSLVSAETIRGRLRRLRQLIEWLYNELHIDNIVPRMVEATFHKLITIIGNDERSLNHNENKNVKNFDESVIPEGIFEDLKRIINPSCKDNPFKGSKLRNYLIVSIIINTGIRRGTLAKIKISDCQFYGPYDRISVYRSPDDRSDPRTNRPSHKTKDHIATVNAHIMETIKLYINTVRCSYPNSSTHDFVFVSEKNSKNTAGLPVSLNTINSIFETFDPHHQFWTLR